MSHDTRYLNLSEAGRYIGQSTRWMRRHWPDLLKDGVRVLRVPKDSVKGRLVLERASLDAYMEKCRIEADFGVVDRPLVSKPRGRPTGLPVE